jgi:hypothetical protein
MTQTSAQDGLPEKIGDAIGTVVVIAVFAMLLWAVARNFL